MILSHSSLRQSPSSHDRLSHHRQGRPRPGSPAFFALTVQREKNVPTRLLPNAITEHAQYMTEVAAISTDIAEATHIDAVLTALRVSGQSPVPPTDRSGLHPYLIPLTRDLHTNDITCVLRWPEGHKGMELPLVKMQHCGTTVQLLARSPTEYLHRVLAEEDYNNRNEILQALSRTDITSTIYEQGAVTRSGLPSLHAYLTRRAGMYPDVCEALALGHINKGDTMSGLITAEWYMRQGNFPDWGRPYEFACSLLEQANRQEESRDMARIALRTPWWTLQNGYQAMKVAAGMEDINGADATRRALEDQDEMANGGALQGKFRTNPKTDKQKRMDEVNHWLNRAAAGEESWDDVRRHISQELRLAGLADMARFVEN